jgi:copper resistance protein B
MAETMGMDDAARYGLLRFDQAEYREGDVFAWDMDAWYGGDYQRLWLKSEGERESDGEWEGRLEGLWSRVIGRWWSTQVGVRHDFGDGASRTWLAAGVEGLAPYFFDLEATGYVSDEGRFAARLAASYDLLLTQRLVLQPDMDLTAFSKSEPSLLRGSGVSALELGLRLRYEFRRELAPYAGFEWVRSFGETSELLRANGDPTSDLRWVAGIRFWF